MKSVDKILKIGRDFLAAAGTVVLMSGCQTELKDHNFDMSALENWQIEKFTEAGNYWKLNSLNVKSSKNKVYVGYIDPINGERIGAEDIKHEDYDVIIFQNTLVWTDCSKDIHGQDFYNVAKHELGHFIDLPHVEDKNNIMHKYHNYYCGVDFEIGAP